MYEVKKFFDLAENNPTQEKFDVICPILHSTDLWKENLLSWYREIPIGNLLIGDAGCIDGSIEIVNKFPRVIIFNHQNFKTLGKSISQLISNVKTKHFFYLQSDVYLPDLWFDSMFSKKDEYDWFGCPANLVYILEQKPPQHSRPLAGSQMGLKKAFDGLDSFIEDDFVYRQEDFVLEQFVKNKNFRVGQNKDVEHLHQVMIRKSIGEDYDDISITINSKRKKEEEERVRATQLFGIIKYCDPIDENIKNAFTAAYLYLLDNRYASFTSLYEFASKYNPKWIGILLGVSIKNIRIVRFFKSRLHL